MHNFIKFKTTGSDAQEILINVEHVTSAAKTSSGVEPRLIDGTSMEVELDDSFLELSRRDDSHYLLQVLRDMYELLRARLR